MSALSNNRTLLRYGILGLPLGCIGLPLYMHLPKYYSDTLPLTLSTIGYVMFAARLVDCLADPFIGHILYRKRAQRRQLSLAAACGLALGVGGLFYLPALDLKYPLLPLSILLSLTYLSYSFMTIAFYSDGIALASGYDQSARLSAFREASIIMGVMMASVLPVALMGRFSEAGAYKLFALGFIMLLGCSLLVYDSGIQPKLASPPNPTPWKRLFSNIMLRWVFSLYSMNAIATSITSTLFLFYVADILKRADMGGVFLGIYFLGTVATMPIWLSLTSRFGKRNTLLLAMCLAVASFGWAFALGANDILQFSFICFVSGAALGGELTVLPSLLSDALPKSDRDGALEFGIWNFISKFNLALAAGIALPLVGSASAASYHQVLRLSYALVPCMFKCLAIAILFISPIERKNT